MAAQQPIHFSAFPDFYKHPLIQRLSTVPRWTVSGVTDKEEAAGGDKSGKAPLCLLLLDEGRRIGAQNHDDWRMPRSDNKFGACGTLADVCDIVPSWPNVTYFLDSAQDSVFAVDIEPTCPDDIKQKFLRTNFIYGEVSMSGKGYHLFYNVNWPQFQKQYEIAAMKDHIQEEHRYYEVHLYHWLTFTRRMILPPAKPDRRTLLDLLIPMFTTVTKSESADLPEWNEQLDIDQIPDGAMIQRTLKTALGPYPRTPADFNGNMSQWEFGHVGYIYRNLLILISKTPVLRAHNYTQEQLLMLLYAEAIARIPYRPKHDTQREGKPWLLYECQHNMAHNTDLRDKFLGPSKLPPHLLPKKKTGQS